MVKKKILFLITGLGAGGAEIMFFRILKKMNLDKFEPVVCSLSNETALVDSIKPFVRRIYVLNTKNYFGAFQTFISVRRILKKEKPQILHCVMPHANLIGRFASIGIRCKNISSLWVVLLEKKYLNFFDKITQFLVDAYSTNSNSLRDFKVKNGINRNKINVIYSGIDFESYKISKDPEIIRKELGLYDGPVLTMVANMRKQKDYPTMIKALYLLRKEMNFYFLSCGSGTQFEDETKNIQSLINQYNLKDIIMLGFRSDMPEILAITDVWVSSTLFEGQSNSLLEAMVFKKPIVTTDIPENAEVVRNENEALLVPTKSPQMLKTAIKRILTDKKLAKSLSENAYHRVHQIFHINNTVNKLERLYNSLLSKI